MATYYKGTLVLTDDFKKITFSKTIGYKIVFITIDSKHFKSPDYANQLTRYIESSNKKVIPLTDTIIYALNEDIVENLNRKVSKIKGIDVIYEVIPDKKGNKYAREIYTKLLFPIPNVDKDISNLYNVYLDFLGYYDLLISKEVKFSSLLDIGCFVNNSSIANQNEINEYLTMFDTGKFNEKRKQKFLEKITKLYNLNVFKEDFNIEESKVKTKTIRKKQSTTTMLMENIEYLLLNLKTKDQEMYLKFQRQYETLIKDPNITYQTLAFLEGEIEANLLFGKEEANGILESLISLKKEYLFNFLTDNEKKTDLTFEKINKINELFLKAKDKYDFLTQREVLKSLAFLYIMEVYENKDVITLEELENSYFLDNLKSIIISLKAMQEEGLIKYDNLYELEELSCEVVFDMIKSIEFNKLQEEQAKELVKNI